MDDLPPLTEWLHRHRAGDPEGSRRLFEHFAQRLCRLVQRHFSSGLRQRTDDEDIVQSVFRSFFVREAEGKFQIENSLDLWKLLVTITLRKARKTWRQNTAAKRAVNLELQGDSDWMASAMCREPTVVEALVLVDEVNSLVEGLSPEHARLLELRLAGCTPTEAARDMGISRQAVYRILDDLQERLRKSDLGSSGE